MVRASRSEHELLPDPSRLVARPFLPGATNFAGDQTRIEHVVGRVIDLPEARRAPLLDELLRQHGGRLADIEQVWEKHFELAQERFRAFSEVTDQPLRQLIGAYLTQTYAYEAAALTNPSIVPWGEPDDHGVQSFVMSARAIGEGHISSIAFLTGTVDLSGSITIDVRHPSSSNGTRRPPNYSRRAFTEKLVELAFMSPPAEAILALLPETFTTTELDQALATVSESDHDEAALQDAVRRVHWLAASNYEVGFDATLPISEHVISPDAPTESQGIEDARFVRFVDDDGTTTYYATYTAFDGISILPQLIETRDFQSFRMATMTGPAVHHKGMAVFPRKIHGQFVALSRHDHEKSYILRSDTARSWNNAEVVFGPESDWDAVQTGNCGSPIETEAGWLVITHGVGAMRRYVLGAVMLDLDEPSKVVGRLHQPFIEPEGDEEVGYVPNVVYSCGSMIHGDYLITPFGYSDVGIKIGITPVADLISAMV